MNAFVRPLFAALLLFFTAVQAQDFPNVQIAFEKPVTANTPFSIIATTRGLCSFPYPERVQPPDFLLATNELDMTVYIRVTGQNGVPNPPCLNRIQTYTGPALQPGTYKLLLRSRFYQSFGAGSFGPRLAQGEIIFEVAGAAPITQVSATSSWSLVLLLLGMLGAVRWVSGHSGR